ncbi:MAG: hypothetical protein J6Q14_01330 [Oscillospiraceae bacterium]|nr:hypothetical protein [Oscillospiraceae bacterium]
MAEVYGAVTDRILVNLARHFPYIHDADEARGSFDYQARMLAQMGQVNRESADIILQSLGGADDALRGALEVAILDALKTEEPKLRKAAQKGLLHGSGLLPPELSANQMQAFQAYYQQSADKLNLVNTVMLESTEAAYRATVADAAARISRSQSILNVGAGEVVTGVSSWNQAMHDAVKKMVENGLTGFVDHGGHKWSPEAYVAMDIRTTMFNTARAAVWERAGQYGADLYQVSSHNGARPLCYPWQGKIISRSDWSGEVEDLYGEKVHVYSQSETSYGLAAGLFGVNCKHYPMTFIPRFSTLKGEPQDPEENAEAYALSQEQRKLERKLREEKRDLEVMRAQGASDDEIKAQRQRVRSASADIESFCDEHDLPRRRNRESAPVRATWPDENGGRVTRFGGDTYIDAGQVPPVKKPASQPAMPPTVYSVSDAVKTANTVNIDAGSNYPVYSGLADIYAMPDGVEFRFKQGMDAAHQSMTPDMLIDSWYKVPQRLRDLGQKRINVVDTYNPSDAYWKSIYKTFTQSYATGGDEITFYRWDYAHNPDYLVRSLSHEIAHKVDTSLGGATRYSEQTDWQKAMADDKAFSGMASITTYGENSPSEDFAESIAEYIKDQNFFLQFMPNRGKLISAILSQGGGGP